MTRRNRARREERARQDRAREQQAAPNALDAVQGKIGRNENAPRTFAPLIVGGVALAAVIGVVAWNAFAPREALTVSALQSPVVGAVGAGEALYPENSREAIGEVVKFGYLPAVDLNGPGVMGRAVPRPPRTHERGPPALGEHGGGLKKRPPTSIAPVVAATGAI